ncbi:MAG: hypothetical protein F4X63_09220 [Nitrospira sp. SB0662_bin_26]|nr:hypothetical protein [Nitrospira sp. SB0662_bin_26]
MAITITGLEVFQELNLDDFITETDTLDTKGQRLFDVASAIVQEYTRGSTVPDAIENEAVVRVTGWIHSTRKRDGGIKSQKVDDLEVEYFSNHKTGVLKHSGAETLLSPFKQRRAL